jgi:hypothetical protein
MLPVMRARPPRGIFVVDMVPLRENLHDRTVRRAGADEQGRDYRLYLTP